METKIQLGKYKAIIDYAATGTKSSIRGEVFPFVSSFFSIKFNMEIKNDFDSDPQISHEIGFSGNSFSGPQAVAYIGAANEALSYVQELLNVSECLSDSNDAIYGLIDCLDENDIDKFIQYILLMPSIKAGLSERCNWNFRSNGSPDENVFAALVKHASFEKIINAMEKGITAKQEMRYHEISDTESKLIQAGYFLAERTGLLGIRKAYFAIDALKLIKIIRSGVDLDNIEYNSLSKHDNF